MEVPQAVWGGVGVLLGLGIEEPIQNGRNEGAAEGGNPVDPEADQRGAITSDATDQLNSSGYRRVEGTTSEATDGEGAGQDDHPSSEGVGLLILLAGVQDVQEHGSHGEGHDQLGAELLPDAQEIRIGLWGWEIQASNRRSVEGGEDGGQYLDQRVSEELSQGDFAEDEDGEGQGRVEVATRDIGKAKEHSHEHVGDGDRGQGADTNGR
jgi:hypothetical protein